MARSIRSKAGKRNRTVLRKKLHAPVEDERLRRLAELQSAENSKPYDFEAALKDRMDLDNSTKGTVPSRLFMYLFYITILLAVAAKRKLGLSEKSKNRNKITKQNLKSKFKVADKNPSWLV